MQDEHKQATRLWVLAQPAVSAFLSSVVRDFRDRDDLLQDVAVAVMESFASYDTQRPFVAWAIGIARNQVGLYLRRRQRDRLVFDDATVACLAQTFADLPPDEMRRTEFLRDCLRRLEARSRSMCELRYRDDLKPAAIAQTLGMTANSVAKALQRIRDVLRECIDRSMTAEGVGG